MSKPSTSKPTESPAIAPAAAEKKDTAAKKNDAAALTAGDIPPAEKVLGQIARAGKLSSDFCKWWGVGVLAVHDGEKIKSGTGKTEVRDLSSHKTVAKLLLDAGYDRQTISRLTRGACNVLRKAQGAGRLREIMDMFIAGAVGVNAARKLLTGDKPALEENAPAPADTTDFAGIVAVASGDDLKTAIPAVVAAYHKAGLLHLLAGAIAEKMPQPSPVVADSKPTVKAA